MSLLKALSVMAQPAFFSYRQEAASCNQAGVTPVPRLGLLGNKFLGLTFFGPGLFMLLR